MNKKLKNILAVIVGIVAGNVVNMSLVVLGPLIIAPPLGIDTSDIEVLKKSMHLFEPKHFIFPFLAHAIGTLMGALVAVKMAKTAHRAFAYLIGGIFFIGGAYMVFALPSPMWFNALDLIFAYFPMSFLALKLAKK